MREFFILLYDILYYFILKLESEIKFFIIISYVVDII